MIAGPIITAGTNFIYNDVTLRVQQAVIHEVISATGKLIHGYVFTPDEKTLLHHIYPKMSATPMETRVVSIQETVALPAPMPRKKSSHSQSQVVRQRRIDVELLRAFIRDTESERVDELSKKAGIWPSTFIKAVKKLDEFAGTTLRTIQKIRKGKTVSAVSNVSLATAVKSKRDTRLKIDRAQLIGFLANTVETNIEKLAAEAKILPFTFRGAIRRLSKKGEKPKVAIQRIRAEVKMSLESTTPMVPLAPQTVVPQIPQTIIVPPSTTPEDLAAIQSGEAKPVSEIDLSTL